MNFKFTDYQDTHPLMRAMLAYSDYDHDPRENVISTTSIMKPIQMIALERSNKDADRVISIDGLIPSVGGNALHNMLERALEETDNDTWKAIGVPEPEMLEIITEQRNEKPVGDHIISGKFDVMFKYKDSKWQIADLKSMSVWGVMIDLPGKKEEWIKQMSIYRYLNQDKDIDDIGVILTWFTDWSKSDALIKAKQGYPQSRTGVEMVNLWSITTTHTYLALQEKQVVTAMTRYTKSGNTDTGERCSKDELWMKKSGWAYYAKGANKKATKIFATEEEATATLARAKDTTAYVEERKAKATRCNYCSVTQFCPQFAEHVARGLV